MEQTELISLLSGHAHEVAPRLLGSYFVRELNSGKRLIGRIVETEAYAQTDAASHSYKGRTTRTDVMFGPPGHLYVYFTYGMHYCCNVVTGAEGYGSGVLIRAVEPIEGADIMAQNRGGKSGVEITNGPAKLSQAYAIDTSYNGSDLRSSPIHLIIKQPLQQENIVQTTRIGISQARDVPWRWYERGNPYVSKL